MKAFSALMRVSLKALLRSIAPGKGGVALAVGVAALLPVVLSLTFGGLFLLVLAPLGMGNLVPGFLCLMGAAMAFLFTAFGAGGVLFGGKDNDLLLALPIPDWMLLTARLTALYLENLLIFALTLLPGMLLCSGSLGNPLGAVLAVPVSVFGALVPTVLATLAGWLITWLISRTHHNALLANLGYLLVLLGCFALSVAINIGTRLSITQGESLGSALSGLFRGPLWVFGQMGEACNGSPAGLAVTLAAGMLPAALLVVLLKGSYRRLLTRMGARSARRKFRMTAQTGSGPFRALLRKEAIRYFHTPIYLFNTGFGLVLLILATAAVCWQKNRVLHLLSQEAGLTLTANDLYAIAAGTVCFLLATVSTSSVSLSLEGRSFWLLKTMPVPLIQLIRAKVWFNVLVGWPITALCVLVLWPVLGFSPLQLLALLLACAGLSAFVSLLGAAANLLFPRLDAQNDTVVCKQSLSAAVGVLGGMALAGIGIGGYLALSAWLSLELYLLLCTAAAALLSLLLAAWLRTAGVRRLAALG